MKSSELMLDDWVIEKSVDYVNGVIKYVEEKRRVTYTMIHQLYEQEIGTLRKDCLYSISVEPIVFNEKLQRKNRLMVENDRFCRETTLWTTTEGFIPNKLLIKIYSYGKIRYIHQVQHLLKQCGCTQNIKL